MPLMGADSQGQNRSHSLGSELNPNSAGPTVENLLQLVHSASPLTRQHIVKNVVSLIIADEKQNIESGLTVLFACARLWKERNSLRLITKAVPQLAKTTTYVATFGARLSKFAQEVQPSKSNPNAHFRDSLHCSGLISTFLVSLTQEQITEHGSLIDTLIASDVLLIEQLKSHANLHTHLQSQLSYLLQTQTDSLLLSKYLGRIAQDASKASVLIKVFLALFAAGPKAKFAPHKASFFTWYTTLIFSSSASHEASVLAAWEPLYKFISHEDFATLLPIASRLLKRSPEAIWHTLLSLISKVPLDLSRYTEEWTGPLVERLKSSKAEDREQASVFLSVLGRKCSHPPALEALLSALTNPLKDKKAKTSVQARQAAVHSIGALTAANGAGSTVLGRLADSALAVLVPLYTSESKSEVKTEIIKVIGKWLVDTQVDEKRGDAAYKLIQTGLTDAKSSHVFLDATVGLLTVFPQGKAKTWLSNGSIVKSLQTRITTAVTKPSTRTSGLLALECLLHKTVLTIRGGKEVNVKKQAWAAILEGDDTFLNHPDALKKLNLSEAHLQIRLLKLVATLYRLSPNTDDSTFSGFFTGLAFLLGNNQGDIRRPVLKEVQNQLNENPNLCSLMLNGFYQALCQNINASSDLLAYTLRHISTQAGVKEIPLLAFCAHYPLVCPPTRSPSRVWDQLARSFKTKVDLVAAFAGEVEGLKTLVFDNGIFSTSSRHPEAARRTLASVFLLTPNLVSLLLSSLLCFVSVSASDFLFFFLI